jgi:hypothetical protein
MRLIINTAVGHRWAYLEPATADEIAALERCVADGEWSIGRGNAAIRRLRRMAARLGYPATEVHEPERAQQVVVQRGSPSLVAMLRALTPPSVPVIVDRRRRERRVGSVAAPADRRRRERRQSPSATWRALRFLVASAE